METIKTSFGSIRPWQDDDLASLVKYANNRKIWANLRDGFPHPYLEENGRAYLETLRGLDPLTIFAIATPEEAIGSIGLFPGKDVHRLTAEMGYWLAEPYWGQGIMSEAATRFTDAAFVAFGLVRIHAEPYATNSGSCRVLEKAGFTLEGRLKASVFKDGKILDQLMYAKIRREN
jgi:RimJ/RimL family protein N-acetyltransferase